MYQKNWAISGMKENELVEHNRVDDNIVVTEVKSEKR